MIRYMMPNHSDPQLKALFRRLKEGDETAYLPLYPLLHVHCASFVGAESADDMVQDTLIMIFKHLSEVVDLTSNPKGWMLKIATNKCLDELRRVRRRQAMVKVNREVDPDETHDRRPQGRFARRTPLRGRGRIAG